MPFGSQCSDDGNECTRDACFPGQDGSLACQHNDVPFGSACADDGNECTTDRCLPGPNGGAVCQHTSVQFGSPCASDGNDCTIDLCQPDQSGLTICQHPAVQPGSRCADDGNDCTFDACGFDSSGSLSCQHNPLQPGSACNDHSPCTQFDACSPAGVCVGSSPVLDCRSAAKASLVIKNNPHDALDLVDYKWVQGAATEEFELGDPTTTTTYTLCIFDGAGTLRMSASVPPGGQCGDVPCWTAKAKGFAYRDELGQAAGIGTVRLLPSASAKSSVHVRGKGANLPLPVLPLAGPVKVQVINDATGVCFASDFAGATGSSDRKYTAQTP